MQDDLELALAQAQRRTAAVEQITQQYGRMQAAAAGKAASAAKAHALQVHNTQCTLATIFAQP